MFTSQGGGGVGGPHTAVADGKESKQNVLLVWKDSRLDEINSTVKCTLRKTMLGIDLLILFCFIGMLSLSYCIV